MSEIPGGGGNFPKREVLHAIKWTQSDRKFCKNEGSIRSKTNEKGGQLDRKLKRKLMQNGKKMMQNP